MRQCAPPSLPRQRQQHLQIVELWRTARSLGTATFQTRTIAANTGIATTGRENTTSAQMTRPQEHQRFTTSSTVGATSRITPTVASALCVTSVTTTAKLATQPL